VLRKKGGKCTPEELRRKPYSGTGKTKNVVETKDCFTWIKLQGQGCIKRGGGTVQGEKTLRSPPLLKTGQEKTSTKKTKKTRHRRKKRKGVFWREKKPLIGEADRDILFSGILKRGEKSRQKKK